MKRILLTGTVCAGLIFSGCEQPASDQNIKIIEAPAPTFELSDTLSQSLPELATALASGDLSSEVLVNAYLDRIETVDRDGPTLQSVLTINPDAISEARRLDTLREDGTLLGPLHGVPVLLKDNIESKDNMATTAGSTALEFNVTGRDSPLAAGLREQGAIILGKTNLSQWANFRSNDSMSGWSALGGQVRNPHMLDRNPCGSSSGSGSAMAASLAAGTVGTETNGSIICPSNANGIVGFKPTVSLVSQDYIVPISFTQDTAGPMTKTVRGSAMMLSAMAKDDATDFAAGLDANSLSGTRVGVLRFAEGSNADIIANFNAAIEDIENLGAEIVEIAEFSPDTENFWTKARMVLDVEFKATINDYLASTPDVIPVRNLEQLIAFNKENADVEMALFDQSIFDEALARNGINDREYRLAVRDVVRAAGRNGITKLMADNNVAVLIAPSGPIAGRIDPINGDVWPAWAGAGYLSAIAGYPHLTVPMGTVHGMPHGLSFMGDKDQDAEVLSFGYAYEQATNHRVDPAFLSSAIERDEIKKSMSRP